MRKPAAISIVIAFLLYSCDLATFDKPQPVNGRSLTSFPKRVIGNYIDADHKSIVIIMDKLVARHYDYDYKVHKDSLDPSYMLVGQTLVDQTNGHREKVIVTGDSIIRHENYTDTLFDLSSNNVLKKFKGYYFLSIPFDKDVWLVQRLSFKRGMLTIGNISTDEDIKKLRQITETTDDTVSTHFSLNRREFKRFIKEEGFENQETFIRIAEKDR